MIADRRSSIVQRRSSSVHFRSWIGVVLLLAFAAPAPAQSPVLYRLSFPAPEQHWMQVEVRFTDVPAGTLRVVMSRTSPGRYAPHDFARYVSEVQIDDGAGRALTAERPSSSEWDVSGHAGTVRVRYRVFGDSTEGTFLGIDSTHAHINMPAAMMWAHGLEERSVRVTFDLPPASGWKVATQLHSTSDPNTFTGGNLAYLIDSPAEASRFALRTFVVGRETFRLALHHDGTDREADRLVQEIQQLVAEEAAVFGEFPAYEGNAYTFLTDLLPSAASDGMEHRNSTVITSPAALRVAGERASVLAAVSHEFFHGWNVERIRPRSLEPFNLEDVNMSGELWLAEGFTNYYGALLLHRAGLAKLSDTAAGWGSTLDTVIRSPARKYRSAEDMSRLAPVVDKSFVFDEPDLEGTYISYYVWGEAIALGLDLTLRERSAGTITLDDYMRAMWTRYGKPGGPTEGLVGHPYTIEDARNCLGDVAGDPAFAADFFDRYISGREVVDYRALLERAGLLLRRRNPGRAWIGPLQLSFEFGGARVSSPTLQDTPVHAAGLDRGDEVLALDDKAVESNATVDQVLRDHRPGDSFQVRIRRDGVPLVLTVTTQEDPRLELVPAETERPLTRSERSLRDAWLRSRQ